MATLLEMHKPPSEALVLMLRDYQAALTEIASAGSIDAAHRVRLESARKVLDGEQSLVEESLKTKEKPSPGPNGPGSNGKLGLSTAPDGTRTLELPPQSVIRITIEIPA